MSRTNSTIKGLLSCSFALALILCKKLLKSNNLIVYSDYELPKD
jgi:hypothetical protein